MRLDHLLSKEKWSLSRKDKGKTRRGAEFVVQFSGSVGPHINGGVAQLGEHLPCKQGVKGSIPFISTKDEHGSMTTEEYRSVAQVVRARA